MKGADILKDLSDLKMLFGCNYFYLNNGTGNDCPKQRMEMEVFEGTISSWRRSPVNLGGTLPIGSEFIKKEFFDFFNLKNDLSKF